MRADRSKGQTIAFGYSSRALSGRKSTTRPNAYSLRIARTYTVSGATSPDTVQMFLMNRVVYVDCACNSWGLPIHRLDHVTPSHVHLIASPKSQV